jgi:hypothetical protein
LFVRFCFLRVRATVQLDGSLGSRPPDKSGYPTFQRHIDQRREVSNVKHSDAHCAAAILVNELLMNVARFDLFPEPVHFS